MSETFYDTFTKILEEELEPALGCTEPIAIAYCASMMRSTLGEMPEHIDIRTSGNIIKNVKAVTVPNSGGMKGIEVAAILGVLGGRADLVLEVLSCITKEQIDEAKVLMAAGFASVELATGVPSLYIEIAGRTACHECTCIVSGEHTNITYLAKDGKVMVDRKASCTAASSEHRTDRSGMSVSRIIDYAKNVPVEDIAPTIDRQIEYNTAIAREGLSRKYGVSVGRTLLTHYDASDVRIRARAMAAAGSDARMSGCSLPVIINSGSGNQGLTVSLPVIEYAKEYHKSHEELVRALALSNLIAIHQKRYIGPLSAFCGAVNAATGAAAGICFLLGGSADGLVPEADMRRLEEWGDEIERCYGHPLAWTSGRGDRLVLATVTRGNGSRTDAVGIDCCILQEEISCGERVRSWRIDAKVNGRWQTVGEGASIGNKRIVHFPEVAASAVRLVIEDSIAEPVIKSFKVFRTGKADR